MIKGVEPHMSCIARAFREQTHFIEEDGPVWVVSGPKRMGMVLFQYCDAFIYLFTGVGEI